MKYLVTGGCGFIGSHLVDALTTAGHFVRILDDLSTGSLNYFPSSAEFIEGDVADPKTVYCAMHGMDGCFHLAAIASVERCNLDWLRTHRINLGGTIAIFSAARKQPLPIPVVYASSAAIYGNNSERLAEDTYPRPISSYGADKLGCELQGFVAYKMYHVSNCGLRFFNVYGPRQDPHSPYSGVITVFCNQMKHDKMIIINGDGEQSRDFIYVDDVVIALFAAMNLCKHSDVCEVFNVCTGIDTTISNLAVQIGLALDRKPCIEYAPRRRGDTRRSVGCAKKSQLMLGFLATTSLASGLKKTLKG